MVIHGGEHEVVEKQEPCCFFCASTIEVHVMVLSHYRPTRFMRVIEDNTSTLSVCTPCVEKHIGISTYELV